MLCIRRTLADGRLYGLISGLGAASADAIYGAIAAFGLTLISNLLLDNRTTLGLLGGLFLLYLGIRTFFTPPSATAADARAGGVFSAYVTTFALTLTNPMTILSFVAIFAGVANTNDTATTPITAAVIVVGVFSGSALWWLTLSTGVSLFRERFSTQIMRYVNRISGAVITIFGIVALLNVI